jgi:hypothetical protein
MTINTGGKFQHETLPYLEVHKLNGLCSMSFGNWDSFLGKMDAAHLQINHSQVEYIWQQLK